MLGSVLSQELLLGSRRGYQQIIRRIYTGWLVAQLAFAYWLYRTDLLFQSFVSVRGTVNAVSDFATSFTRTLVLQQIILLLLATPAYMAGAITDEKSRGTLQYLLAADLTPWEIVVGKLLGRVSQVALLALAALPMLCFIGLFSGVDLTFLLAFVAVTVAPLFALSSASLLASVWSRQTRDAVLAVYFCGVAGFLLLWGTGSLYLFDPLHVLQPAWAGDQDIKELARRLLLSALAWGGTGAVCLGLAVWRLRPAYLRQLEGQGRPKKVRWWRAHRPDVPDEPIRWKERLIEGLAPLAVLRQVPRWLGIVLIFTATVVSSVAILWTSREQDISFSAFAKLLVSLQLHQLVSVGGQADIGFLWQGIVAMLVAALVVAVRCSGAVTGERERQTWEALLMTPLPVEDLIRGKLRGIIGASYPYLLSYAVPSLFLAFLGGGWALFWIALWLAVTLLAMNFVGAAGLWSSVRSKSSWRSLLTTLGIGYAGGFVLYGVAVPVAGIIFVLILLTLTIIDLVNNNQTALARAFSGTFHFFLVATCLASVLAFVLMTRFLLSSAQSYVADRERIRHWKEEPRSPWSRRRRRRRPRAKADQAEDVPDVLRVESDDQK